MDEALKREVLASCTARASFYRFLASVFLHELTDRQIEAIATTRFPHDGSTITQGYELIAEYLKHRDTGTRQQLAVDYAHVFLGAGSYDRLTAPPYESVYTSEENLLMQDARDGALAYYRAEYLDLPAENTTPEDHVGYEMQFMATLVERTHEALLSGEDQRFAPLISVQNSFFNEHLAHWLPMFANDIDKHCKTGFYHGIALLVCGLLEVERPIIDELASLECDEMV